MDNWFCHEDRKTQRGTKFLINAPGAISPFLLLTLYFLLLTFMFCHEGRMAQRDTKFLINAPGIISPFLLLTFDF
jgi:ABC-type sulfate transport system permease subunit